METIDTIIQPISSTEGNVAEAAPIRAQETDDELLDAYSRAVVSVVTVSRRS